MDDITIENVDEFTIEKKSKKDENCDIWGLSSHTTLVLKEEFDVTSPPGAVVVCGPRESFYYSFIIRDSKLERKLEKYKRKFDTERFEHLKKTNTPENIANKVLGEVLRDGKSTPYKEDISDYNVEVEIKETDEDTYRPSGYEIRAKWSKQK